ncbi:MAG: hypothetical protein QME92_05420 [Bacillota bacterium]|nr:hypothetical protein [Bacillota bacterium]
MTSARKKTLENQVAAELKSELGMSETEARLLASRMNRWLLSKPEVRGPEQIVIEAVDGRNSFVRNGHGAVKKVKLTVFVFSPEDLDLRLSVGSEIRASLVGASRLPVLARRGALDLASLSAKSNEARRKRAVPGVQHRQPLEKWQ